MAIISLGIDLMQISRLEAAVGRRGARFLNRIYTPAEQAYCDARAARFAHLAGRYAVKEAVMKVLGTGWSRGVRWVDIEVLRDPGQAPRVVLHGASARIAQDRGIAAIHVTITHDAGIAAAVAVAESE